TRFSRDWSSDVCSSDLFANLTAYAGQWPLQEQDGAEQQKHHLDDEFLSAIEYRIDGGRLRVFAEKNEIRFGDLREKAVARAAVRSEERRVGTECRCEWW